MVIAKRPSKITLPAVNSGWTNLLDFLTERFPLINQAKWQARFKQGKIHWSSGEIVDTDEPFQANRILCYYRELEREPQIPFEHHIIYQNEHFLVACKPHFLPVTPGGKYINECLLERLRQQLKLDELVPMHRLDRETAGLVLFSTNKQSRGIYCQLFAQQKIVKNYQAVAELSEQLLNSQEPQNWTISNRLEKAEPRFIMRQVAGKSNAQSKITLLEKNQPLGLFELQPLTGKTHQLRLHMLKIGMPILNDKLYPSLLPEQKLNFESPLQLLAKKIEFIDPLTKQYHQFESGRQLSSWKVD